MKRHVHLQRVERKKNDDFEKNKRIGQSKRRTKVEKRKKNRVGEKKSL